VSVESRRYKRLDLHLLTLELSCIYKLASATAITALDTTSRLVLGHALRMEELVKAGSRDAAALQAAFTQAVHKWVLPAIAVVALKISAACYTINLSGAQHYESSTQAPCRAVRPRCESQRGLCSRTQSSSWPRYAKSNHPRVTGNQLICQYVVRSCLLPWFKCCVWCRSSCS
jgi:hypothetical protein